MPPPIPVYKGELISLVKMTSVVGYMAAMDLNNAADIIRSRNFGAFTRRSDWLLCEAIEATGSVDAPTVTPSPIMSNGSPNGWGGDG